MRSPSATPSAWANPPSTWPSTMTGCNWRPQSWTMTYLRIVSCPVTGSTSTTATWTPRAQVVRAHLGEHGLVTLARRRHADPHRDVPVLVDRDRRPLSRAGTASGLDVRGDAQSDATPLTPELGLASTPAVVVREVEGAT